jgi:hypothetical protein
MAGIIGRSTPGWPISFDGASARPEGGGTVSECFQAASRMILGDKESLAPEWMRVADRNELRGRGAEASGHISHGDELLPARRRLYRQADSI